MNKRFSDVEGKKFGKLKVIEFAGISKHKKSIWKCECECGNTKDIILSNIVNGKTTSCGCERKKQLRERVKKHGESGSKLYTMWLGMKSRCYRKDNVSYINYGARGIQVCEEWVNDFSVFRDWAYSNGYKESLSVERVDNDKGYCPENCTLILKENQNKNRRMNHYITINGETNTISEWSRISGLNRDTISRRVKRGITGTDLINKERVYTSR